MRRFSPLLLLLFFSACSGKAIDRDGGDLTRSEVEFLSTHMAAAVEREFPLLKHKLVNRYVDSLGQMIVSRNPDMPPLPYEFRLLRSNEVLLFSLPGGVIYLTLGTLRAVELEGQLASALAHELAHQQLNHPLIHWRRKVNASRGQKYRLDFSGSFADEFLGKTGALYFDQGMEEEADRLAPVILYRSQFDPRLYTSYLQLFRRLETTETERIASMGTLHPPTPQRLNWVKEELVKLPPLRDPRVSSPSFQEIKQILRDAEKRAPKQPAKKSEKSQPEETIQ